MPSRRLLTRVFLRRFMENDLISPDTDHMQVVSTVAGGLFAGAAAVALLTGLKYLMMPFPSPARAAVIEADDLFLFCAWPMLVMALVAFVEWDALGFDARDSVVLGQLPIPRATIVLAKLNAIVLFAGVFLASVTFVSALLHSVLVISRLPGGLSTMVVLFVAQVISSVGAGLFGFSVALAARETMHALVGASVFRRISRALQAALLTVCATALLLMPLASSRVVQRIVHAGAAQSLLPPDWFVAVHEAIGGRLVAALPGPALPPQVARRERLAAAQYDAARPAFAALARRALMAFLIACALAAGGFAWNARRLAPPPLDRGRSSLLRWVDHAAVVLVARNPTVRASFQFTGKTLARSMAHRIAMVVAVAAGMAASVVVMHASVARGGGLTPLVLAMEPFTVAVLLAAFRHSVTLPAELRAAWGVSVVWQGRVREYFAGVKRAAIVWIVLPATMVFAPVYVWMAGWRTAGWLATFGILLGCVLLDALLLAQRTLPFVTEHVRSENLNIRAPFYLLALLVGAYWFGWLEEAALSAANGALPLALTLAGLVLALRFVDARRRAGWIGLEFEKEPEFVSLLQ